MDSLTVFGLLAVTAMLVTYALERRSRWYVLGFAAACALGSIYGCTGGGSGLGHPGPHRPARTTHSTTDAQKALSPNATDGSGRGA